MKDLETKITEALKAMKLAEAKAPAVLKNTKHNRWVWALTAQLKNKSSLCPKGIAKTVARFEDAVSRGAQYEKVFMQLVDEVSNGIPEKELAEAKSVIDRS